MFRNKKFRVLISVIIVLVASVFFLTACKDTVSEVLQGIDEGGLIGGTDKEVETETGGGSLTGGDNNNNTVTDENNNNNNNNDNNNGNTVGGEDNSGGSTPVNKSAAPFDYYRDAYGLEAGHVFKTIVAPDLDLLLAGYGTAGYSNATAGTEGKFAVLFGGAWDEYTRAIISAINDEAKKQGISTVYVLDTYFDGKIGNSLKPLGTLTQGDIDKLYKETELGVAEKSGGVGAGYSLTQIIGRFPTLQSTEWLDAATVLRSGAEKTAANTAVLFAVDVPKATSSRATDALKSKIIASYQNKTVTDADALSTNDKEAIADVLSNVAGAEGEFDAFILRDKQTNLLAIQGVTKNVYFQTVSYAELIALLSYEGDHVIFFATFACGDAAKTWKPLYEEALNTNNRFNGTIYVFDASRDNTTSDVIRGNSSSTTVKPILWAHLLDTFFAGYESRYNVVTVNQATNGHFQAIAENTKANGNGNSVSVGGIAYARICLPSLFLYNKEVKGNVTTETEESLGGIIDLFELELNGGDGKIEFANKYFSLLLQKYGIAQALIEEGYTVEAVRNGVTANKIIGLNDDGTVIIPSGTNAVASGATVTASAGTLKESGFGIDVTIIAVKDDEALTIVYHYFADESEAAALKGTGTAALVTARNTVLNYYIDNAETTEGAIALYSEEENFTEVSANIVYFGTDEAIAILEGILG